MSRRAAIIFLVAVCCLHFPTELEAVQPGGLACEGCHGVVAELHERLSKPTSASIESRVPQLLGKICKLENLVKYVYSPPKMVKACNELIGQHKADITDSLIDHFDENPKVTANELEADICFKIAKSCEGIKASPDEKVSQTVVADQMLDAKSGQNIILEQDGDKIVPKVKDAKTEKTAEEKPKKTKKNKEKSETDSKKDKENSKPKKAKSDHENTKASKKVHEKTEL